MFKCGYFKEPVMFRHISDMLSISGLCIHSADRWPGSTMCYYMNSNALDHPNYMYSDYIQSIYLPGTSQRLNRHILFGEQIRFTREYLQNTTYREIIDNLHKS